MPSILVVEQDPGYLDPIQEALTAEGFKVRTVSSQAAALHAAASEAPDLVVVSATVPGMEAVASSFSRSAGGPGVVALLAENGAASGMGGIEADELLAKPFTPEELRQVVRRLLSTRRDPPPPVPAVGNEHKLTSRDIFGDMLAEVESEGTGPALPPTRPPVLRPATAPDEELQRKLEQTLSGVLGTATPSRPRPAPATPPAPPLAPKKGEDAAGDELDALISRTLSSLEKGRPAAAKPAPPAPSPTAAAPKSAPAAAPPAPPSPVESTAVRKAQRQGTGIDFAELEELGRTRRKPEASRPAAPAPAVPAMPPVPAGSRPTAAPPPAAAPAPVRPPAAPPIAPIAPTPAAAAPRPTPSIAPLPAPALAPPPPLPSPPPPPAAPAPVPPDVATTQRIQVVEGQQPGERFGQYTLQEKIAVGGMAEVWKARMRGVEGFQKTVAIKKILPHLGDNADFVSMFIDEAKLAAQLSHPNIIHIYDLGKIGRDFYIAMEYVEGKDLRSILNAAKRKGMPLPMGLALLIAARLASALDYAHRKRDFDNREMGLVHRDVSPQNVLITFEGDIKLCDFGIAKAVSKANQTQMGALKGKLQYMSPEQAWGKPVDARSDLFSLGAILFEMLTGERLFPGDSEISILEAVRDGRTRSARSVLPSVPGEIDEIVEKALARDSNDRFPSASEMQSRLEAVLYSLKPTPSHTDLAAYMHRLLSAEAAPEPFGPHVPELPPPPPLPPAEPPAYVVAEPEPPAAEPYPPEVPALAPLGEMRGEEGERRGRTLLYAAIAALVVIGIVLYFVFGRRGPRVAPPATAPSAQAQGAAPGGLPAPPPGPAAAAAPAVPPKSGKLDISGMVDQEVAKREGEIRKQLEEKQKKLEKELAQAKAAGKSTAPAVPVSTASPAPAPPRPAVEMPEAAKAAPEPAPKPEPPAPVPSPAKAEEPAPAPTQPPPSRPAPEPVAPVRTGDLVVGGPGVVPPELVSFSKPEYPPVARRMGVEGTVVVSILVDENGRVGEAKILTPISQNVGINEAAVKAARAAHYKPAVKDGVKVKMWTRLKIPFKL